MGIEEVIREEIADNKQFLAIVDRITGITLNIDGNSWFIKSSEELREILRIYFNSLIEKERYALESLEDYDIVGGVLYRKDVVFDPEVGGLVIGYVRV